MNFSSFIIVMKKNIFAQLKRNLNFEHKLFVVRLSAKFIWINASLGKGKARLFIERSNSFPI